MPYPNDDPKIKTVDGIDIHVNSDGRFHARVNGKVLYRNNLRELERILVTAGSPVPALVLGSLNPYTRSIECIEIGSFSPAGTVLDTKRQRVKTSYSEHLYAWDDEIVTELRSIIAQNRSLQEEWHAVQKRLTILTRDEFKRRSIAAAAESDTEEASGNQATA